MAKRKLSIPLAWLQLRWDKFRLAAAVAGIVFAVTLMLMQLGFRDALFVAAIQMHDRLGADLMIVSSKYEFMAATQSFPEHHLERLRAMEEIESVAPVYLGLARWRNPVNHRKIPIFVIGMDPARTWFNDPEIQSNLDQLKLPDTVFFDRGSKADFGPIPQMFKEQGSVTTEIADRRIAVGGLFFMGLSWGADGNLVTSDVNFIRLLPGRPQGMIDLGLIRLKPGADAKRVLAAIRAELPPNLQAMNRAEYRRYEITYWAKRTPVGFIFNLGALVGFIVGAVIVYQILYTDVTDHLGEYATLKAMGYSDRQLSWVVLQEALILSLLGFFPGLAISTGLSILTRVMTMLPSYMTWERATTVLVLTMFMCAGSGLIAMRKLRGADPADIF